MRGGPSARAGTIASMRRVRGHVKCSRLRLCISWSATWSSCRLWGLSRSALSNTKGLSLPAQGIRRKTGSLRCGWPSRFDQSYQLTERPRGPRADTPTDRTLGALSWRYARSLDRRSQVLRHSVLLMCVCASQSARHDVVSQSSGRRCSLVWTSSTGSSAGASKFANRASAVTRAHRTNKPAMDSARMS